MNTPIEIGVYRGNDLIKIIPTSFLGPVKKREKSETRPDESGRVPYDQKKKL